MNKLELIPDQSGFATTFATGVLVAPLDGGAPRSRLDIVGGWHTVDVLWVTSGNGYEYLRTVARFCEENGGYHFEVDLPMDYATPSTCEAMFVPGTIKLSQQQGDAYNVTAQLYVKSPATLPAVWPSITDQQQGIITTEGGDPITT